MIVKGLQIIAEARDAAAYGKGSGTSRNHWKAYEMYVKGLESLLIFSAHPEFVRIKSKVEGYVSEVKKLTEALDQEAPDQSEDYNIDSDVSTPDDATWQSELYLRCSENGRTVRGKPRLQLKSFGGPGGHLCDKCYVVACKMEGWAPEEVNDEESDQGAAGTPSGPAKNSESQSYPEGYLDDPQEFREKLLAKKAADSMH